MVRTQKNEKKRWLIILVFFCTVFFCLFGIAVLTSIYVPELLSTEQINQFDFTANVGKIDRDLFDFYAEKLYSPSDFASGNTENPSYTVDSPDNKNRQFVDYGTYRLMIPLPAGQVYAISADSATYSQKVWINGQLLSDVGTVADCAEDFVPRTNFYVVCFTPSENMTEIVIQRSNFVHKSGTLFELDLGPQKQIMEMKDIKLFRSILALGVVFTAFLFFLGVSLFFPQYRRFLWFSLACLFLGIHSSFVSPKPVMILFPELNWYLGHKLECSSTILTYLCVLLFYNSVFPKAVPRAVRIVGYSLCAVGLGVYLILPSSIYSYLTQTAVYLMAAYLVVCATLFIFGIIKKKVLMDSTARVLMAAGVLITMFCSVADELLYRKTADYNISQVGILMFIFLTSLALTLQMHEAEEALDEATKREAEMRQKTHELSNLYQMRSDFLSDISHELKTPLTVMSGYAGLTKMQLEKDAVNEKTPDNLEIIQKEAVRLGTLVEQLKTVSADKNGRTLSPVRTDISETLCRAAEFCRPICEKNGNCIKTELPEEPLFAYYVSDSILQVFYNLIANSNRHCRDNVITLKAEKNGRFIKVSVSDNGSGISPEVMQHIFERGVSGDHSSGLGLALCRDIIEDGGGIIQIESRIGEGTSVIFTVPGGETADVQG